MGTLNLSEQVRAMKQLERDNKRAMEGRIRSCGPSKAFDEGWDRMPKRRTSKLEVVAKRPGRTTYRFKG